jgi:predicted ribosomally synthesized peptide with SipW-like signal peptide
MKNVFLSIVVVATLIAAGVGGTLADFSDIETSRNNYVKTGSLDLKVSDYAGNLYQDPNVPPFFEVMDAWPCCVDKSVFFDLENFGQGFQRIPWAYLHFKNMECGWIVPKNVWAWIDCDPVTGECIVVPAPDPEPPAGTQGTGYPKPVNEPEFVAECGGIAGEDADGNPVVVPGVGCCYGEDCQLKRHVDVHILIAGPYPEDVKPPTSTDVPDDDWRVVDLSRYDTDPRDGIIKLNEIECHEIELGQIPNNAGIWVHIWVHLQDIDEDDLGLHYFDETIPEEAKWDHWPTNAIQKDSLHFDMAFELLQNRYVPGP